MLFFDGISLLLVKLLFYFFWRAPKGSRLPLYLPSGGCRCNRSRSCDKDQWDSFWFFICN